MQYAKDTNNFCDVMLNCKTVFFRPPIGCSDHIIHLKFESSTVNQFQFKLARTIELCQKRIDWLMEGSRKVL